MSKDREIKRYSPIKVDNDTEFKWNVYQHPKADFVLYNCKKAL